MSAHQQKFIDADRDPLPTEGGPAGNASNKLLSAAAQVRITRSSESHDRKPIRQIFVILCNESNLFPFLRERSHPQLMMNAVPQKRHGNLESSR